MNKVTVIITCPKCKTEHGIEMTHQQHREWQTGKKHIQNIFPNLSPDDREMLISGICSKCWDEIFGDEE